MRRVLTTLLSAISLLGCVATGSGFAPPGPVAPGRALLVVYRISLAGGTAGSWVSTRVELDGAMAGKLPADSFLVLQVGAGEITLSATDMINLDYADKDRVTLRETIQSAETAYFRLISVFGDNCAAVAEGVVATSSASAAHYPRRDWIQTTCFSKVQEHIALKDLSGLRQAD